VNKVIIEGDGTEVRNCKFVFKCPKFWAELQKSDDPDIRHCNECSEFVYRCTSNKDIAIAIKRNRCVAIMPFFDESNENVTSLVGRIAPD